MTEEWDKLIAEGKNEIEVTDWMTRLTMDVLGRALLDEEFETVKTKDSRLVQLYRKSMEGVFDFKYTVATWLDVRWNPWRRPYFDAVDEWNAYMMDLISKKWVQVRERLASGEDQVDKKDKDLLTLMLETILQGEEDALEDDEIRCNLTIIALAGHDTTSIALTAILYYLAKYPHIQQKARMEVESVVPSDEDMTAKTRLPYLDAIIHESIRLTPPVNVLPFRLLKQDSVLEGSAQTLPAGTIYSVDVTSMHRQPDYWQDPHEFKPERWLAEDKDGKRRDGFWGFGGGARICIGMNFSLLEQRVTISKLLRRYKWTLPVDSPHKDRLEVHGIIVSKPRPLGIHFEMRQ